MYKLAKWTADHFDVKQRENAKTAKNGIPVKLLMSFLQSKFKTHTAE